MRNVLAFAKKYMTPYKGPIAVAQLIFLLSMGVGLLMPLVIRHAIDVGILSNNFDTLIYTALFVFGIGFARLVMGYYGKVLRFRTTSQVMSDMRIELFSKLLRVGPEVKEKFNSGELIARMTTEISVMRNMVNGGVLDIVNNFIVVVTVLVISLMLDWKLTLIASVPHMIVGILSVSVGYTLLKWVLEVRKRFATMTNAVYESLSSVQIIKIFGREKSETNKFDGLSNRMASTNKTVTIRQTLYMSTYGILAVFSMLLMMWFGAKDVINGSLTPGTYVAMMGYMMTLHMPFHTLIGSMYNWFKADSAIERINELLNMKEGELNLSERTQQLQGVRGHLEVSGVSFTAGSNKLLDNVNFTAKPGDLVALVGQSGSGKSVALQVMANMIDTYNGSVKLDGTDLKKVTIESLRGNAVYVTQEPWLFQDTLRNNIAFSRPEASTKEIEEAVDRAGLRNLVNALPEGLNTVIGTRGLTLSGGERQRVGLARALLVRPKVIFFDDPTANVDAETEQQLMDTIVSLQKDHTLVIATQRSSVARHANQLYVLDNGKLTAKGDPKEIQKGSKTGDLVQLALAPSQS